MTERGAPIAVIKPLAREAGPEQRVRLLEEQGVLIRSVRTTFPLRAPVVLKGRAIAETVIDNHAERVAEMRAPHGGVLLPAPPPLFAPMRSA